MTLKYRNCRSLTQPINAIDFIATRPIPRPTRRIIVRALFISNRLNESFPDVYSARAVLPLLCSLGGENTSWNVSDPRAAFPQKWCCGGGVARYLKATSYVGVTWRARDECHVPGRMRQQESLTGFLFCECEVQDKHATKRRRRGKNSSE